MKWMLSAAIAVAVSSAAAAQSGKSMSKSSASDMMTTTTYTGCVEAVNHGGQFMLTHIGAAPMAAMKSDAMMKGDAPMKSDAMMMKDDATMKKDESMAMDHMAPQAVVLTGSSDLKKHVGQKVTVKGSLMAGAMNTKRDDVSTLTVGSLTVVAKSCS